MVRALEFYSGIGGMHLALTRSSVAGSVVCAFDWDPLACQVYSANHPGTAITKTDISTLTAVSLSSLRADLWLLSPSCQPYTVLNPQAKGALDPRAASFLHLVSTVLPDLASSRSHPSHLLVENVAGFETSSTRNVLVSTLKSLDYTTFECLLTPLQFDIPNSRLRYYLLAKSKPLVFPHPVQDKMWTHIPGYGQPWNDPRTSSSAEYTLSTRDLRPYLDKSPSDIHAVPDRTLSRWGRLFDIVLPSSRRTCCFTRGYTQLVERSGSILQTNEELDTLSTFNAFLSAHSTCSDAVQILHPLGLRYFSPSELLRLFHFERPTSNMDADYKFQWSPGVSMKSQYRLIGNSINVRVVNELIDFLYEGE